jgi:putative CocE/NonD family hydrolase
MRRPSRTQLLLTVLAIAVIVAAAITYLSRGDSKPIASGVASDVGKTIPTAGATLSAEVITPKGAAKPPLVVMPAGWGQPATEYRAIARLFAERGYLVVAYAQRGFPASTGAVDFAGPATQRDASTVITWALAHTPADPQRIGMLGISYGAGVSLLAAAHDPRIKAVTALSTWADVGATFDQQNTPSTAALASLIGGARPKASFDATVRALRSTLATKPKSIGTATRAISRTRSPVTYVAQLNKNRPAIMVANAFEDSIFPPAQLLPFFQALTTPKRLELAAGDHGGPELSGLLGQPNRTIDDARAWLDHYLRGTANGIETEGPILLHDVRSNELRALTSWPKPSAKDQVQLGKPGSSAQTGSTAAATWRSTLQAGVDSGASSGQARLVPASAFAPPQLLVPALPKSKALVWNGPALLTRVLLNGTPTVRFSLGSSADVATVYLYLYDVDPRGVGSLVDMQPYTATGLTPGALRPVTISMQPISWTVPSGNHLTFVVDTVDARFQSLNPAGATITVASDAGRPARFTAPVHR